MITWPGRTILLDIEGTVSEIAFVHQVLFPYARAKARAYLETEAENPALVPVLDTMARDAGAPDFAHWSPGPAGSPETIAFLVGQIHQWMDRDAKLTGLKALQGLIWQQGYADGTLRSHVFPEVRECFEAWVAAGLKIAIYSSGSIAAQKLLFAHTIAGDLTPFISGYFDTTSGPKREVASYRTIAGRLGLAPSEILFLSDIPEELAAAEEAGMAVGLAVRPGNKPTEDGRFPRFSSLVEVVRPAIRTS